MKRALCLLLVFAMVLPNFTLFAAAEETRGEVAETVETVFVTEEIEEKAEEATAETAAEETVLAETEPVTEAVEETAAATEAAEETTVVTEAAEETTVVTEAVEETTVATEPVVETTVATEPAVETTVATEPAVETTVATEAAEETAAATEPEVEETAAAEQTEEALMEEVPGIEQNGSYYYFYSFEQLKQLAAGTYTDWAEANYQGTEDLVISEDLTMPENLQLSTWEQDVYLVVPEGVTLQVGRVHTQYMRVDGAVYNQDTVNVGEELTVNGSMHVGSDVHLADGAVLNGRENMTFDRENSGLNKNISVTTPAEMTAAMERITGETDVQVFYYLNIQESMVLTQSVEIPEHCELSINYNCTVTLAAGCTLTVNTYFPLTGKLIVEGTLVNNRELGVQGDGSITFQNGGSYRGDGDLWASNYDVDSLDKMLIGFDFTGYEVTGETGDWHIKYVGDLIKLSDPTDLQWGTYYRSIWNENGQLERYEAEPMPGAWSLKFGEAYQGNLEVLIYREDGNEMLGSWGGSANEAGEVYSGDLNFLEDIESGNYYFTAIVRGDYETYCDSNLVTSPVYSYTKPDAKLEACTDLGWDGMWTSYTGPSDTTYVAGHKTRFFYASEEGGELKLIQESWSYDGPNGGIQAINGFVGEYGVGYYYYQIRTLSSDIEKYCNSDFSALSTPYYFDGTWPEEPDPTVPDAPVEPEEPGVGSCGENVSWTFDDKSGLLHIFGTGDMYEYNLSDNLTPWHGLMGTIQEVQIDEGVTSISANAFFCAHGMQRITIADSVTKIGADAFHCCCALTEVTLPGNLREMYGAPFLSCRALKDIWIADSNTFFKSENGVLVTEDGTSLVAYPAGKEGNTYTVPAGVETIGAWAFAGCVNLTTVVLPDSVRFIGGNAFEGSYNLQTLKLGGKLQQIGPWAFYGCETLTEITFPASLTTIENLAFGHCTALSKITFQGDAPAIYNESGKATGPAFFGVTAKVYYPVTGKGWSDAKKNYGGTLTWVAYGELEAPTVKVTNQASNGKPSLSWDAVAGAEEYQVWSSTTGKAGSFKRLITVTKTSHVHAKAVTGTKYFYKIRAVGADGVQSEFSNTVSRKSDLAQPKIEAFARADNGKIKINWDKVEGAVKYQVYRSTAKAGDYTLVKTTPDRSYADNNVTLNKLYYYKVRAVYSDTDCNSAFSAIDSARCILPQPSITLSTVDASGKVKISWAKIANAAKYEVYRATKKDGSYTKIATTTNLSATDTTGKAGTTYFYKIKAVHSNVNASSAYSAAKSRLVKLAQPVVKASNITASGKIHLEWAKVEGATSYLIYRSTSKTGSYKLMWTVTDTSYNNIFQIEAGKTYYYKIKAVMSSNENATSIFSEIVSKVCKLEQPEVTVANYMIPYEPTVKNTKDRNVLRVSWKKVSGAAKYEVYRATSKNGTYYRQTTTTKLVYDDYDVTVGKTYYYKVKAIHSNSDANSAASGIKSALNKLATPSRVSAGIANSGKPYLNLGSVYEATHFAIYRATQKDGTYTKIASVKPGTGPSKTWTDTTKGITPGKTYYYKVKAVKSNNTAVDSGFSGIVSAKARLATPQITSAEMYKGYASLRWEKVDGAVKYEIYRSNAWNDGGYTRVYTTKETSYLSIIKHSAGKYYYKVKAIYKDSAGNSALSSRVCPK